MFHTLIIGQTIFCSVPKPALWKQTMSVNPYIDRHFRPTKLAQQIVRDQREGIRGDNLIHARGGDGSSETSEAGACLGIVIILFAALCCIHAFGVNGPLSSWVSFGEGDGAHARNRVLFAGSPYWQAKVEGTIFEWAGNFAFVWILMLLCACGK